jgi:hypothetical protein
VREVLGDWKVTATMAPFAVDASVGIVELLIRAAGVVNYSSSPSFGWTSVLTFCPGATGSSAGSSSVTGVFTVSGGFRGPIDIKWWDPINNKLCITSWFKDNVVNLYFEPI